METKKYLEDHDYCDAVVIGWDTQLTYGKLRCALMFLLKGAVYYATNEDATYPVPNTLWPGTGASLAYITKAYGSKPLEIFGKPHSIGYQTILASYQMSPDQAVMVGDRLDTDILGANRLGITSICVETGVHSRNDITKFPKNCLPTAFFKNLNEFLQHALL